METSLRQWKIIPACWSRKSVMSSWLVCISSKFPSLLSLFYIAFFLSGAAWVTLVTTLVIYLCYNSCDRKKWKTTNLGLQLWSPSVPQFHQVPILWCLIREPGHGVCALLPLHTVSLRVSTPSFPGVTAVYGWMFVLFRELSWNKFCIFIGFHCGDFLNSVSSLKGGYVNKSHSIIIPHKPPSETIVTQVS